MRFNAETCRERACLLNKRVEDFNEMWNFTNEAKMVFDFGEPMNIQNLKMFTPHQEGQYLQVFDQIQVDYLAKDEWVKLDQYKDALANIDFEDIKTSKVRLSLEHGTNTKISSASCSFAGETTTTTSIPSFRDVSFRDGIYSRPFSCEETCDILHNNKFCWHGIHDCDVELANVDELSQFLFDDYELNFPETWPGTGDEIPQPILCNCDKTGSSKVADGFQEFGGELAICESYAQFIAFKQPTATEQESILDELCTNVFGSKFGQELARKVNNDLRFKDTNQNFPDYFSYHECPLLKCGEQQIWIKAFVPIKVYTVGNIKMGCSIFNLVFIIVIVACFIRFMNDVSVLQEDLHAIECQVSLNQSRAKNQNLQSYQF